jgi:hypothetical protein
VVELDFEDRFSFFSEFDELREGTREVEGSEKSRLRLASQENRRRCA